MNHAANFDWNTPLWYSQTLGQNYPGNGQCVHPSVVECLSASEVGHTWGPSGNAWNYYMSMTAYTAGNDYYERPALLSSGNGYSWQYPAALVAASDGNKYLDWVDNYDQYNHHMCDPDLKYNPDGGIYPDVGAMRVYYVERYASQEYRFLHLTEVEREGSAYVLYTYGPAPFAVPLRELGPPVSLHRS